MMVRVALSWGSMFLAKNDAAAIFADPHVRARDVLVAVEHPGSSRPVVLPNSPIHMTATPPGVYRLKGVIEVNSRTAVRRYVVNLVGTTIHLAKAPDSASANHLVAIGMQLAADDVRAQLVHALQPGSASAGGLRRLQRYRRLSI